jgi:hypothetical protein
MYETQFSNGEPITSYSACSHAEGFCEGENASAEDQIKAWSFLIGTDLCSQLQGWYGRAAKSIIEGGSISPDGTVDWNLVNNVIGSQSE